VIPPSLRLIARLAALGAIAGALCLTGCGRKAGLDAPPSAAIDHPAAAGPDGTPVGPQAVGPDGRPIAPGAPNKRLPMDVLLD